MRTKPALLLIVAVTGWSLAPPAPESRESALGEEIITVIAAALDSPAPALSTIGILDGTWDRIADLGIAAGIGKYAEESGTAVECSWDGDAGRHACSGNPSLFLVFEPYEGDASSDEIRFMVSTLDFGTGFRLTARVVPIETGGSTIGPPRFTGFLHFAYEPPGDTGEELPERDNCRATHTHGFSGLGFSERRTRAACSGSTTPTTPTTSTPVPVSSTVRCTATAIPVERKSGSTGVSNPLEVFRTR